MGNATFSFFPTEQIVVHNLFSTFTIVGAKGEKGEKGERGLKGDPGVGGALSTNGAKGEKVQQLYAVLLRYFHAKTPSPFQNTQTSKIHHQNTAIMLV